MPDEMTTWSTKSKKFVIFVLLLGLCWFAGRYFTVDLDYYRAFFAQFPVYLSGFIYVIVYVGLTFFVWFGAKDVLRVSAALLFGPYVSTIFVWVGELGNAVVLFHLSRKLGQEYVVQKFKLDESNLAKFQDRLGTLEVLALRLNPLVPVRLMDLAFGLTPVKFRKYFAVILPATLIRVFGVQYILAAVGETIFENPRVVNDYLMQNMQMVFYGAIYFLVVLILTMVAVVLEINRKKKQV